MFQLIAAFFDIFSDALEFPLLLGQQLLGILEALHDSGLIFLGAAHGMFELDGSFRLFLLGWFLLDDGFLADFDGLTFVDCPFRLGEYLSLLLDKTSIS